MHISSKGDRGISHEIYSTAISERARRQLPPSPSLVILFENTRGSLPPRVMDYGSLPERLPSSAGLPQEIQQFTRAPSHPRRSAERLTDARPLTTQANILPVLRRQLPLARPDFVQRLGIVHPAILDHVLQ